MTDLAIQKYMYQSIIQKLEKTQELTILIMRLACKKSYYANFLYIEYIIFLCFLLLLRLLYIFFRLWLWTFIMVSN